MNIVYWTPGEGGSVVRRYSATRPQPSRQVFDVFFRWEIEFPAGTIREERA